MRIGGRGPDNPKTHYMPLFIVIRNGLSVSYDYALLKNIHSFKEMKIFMF